VQWGWVEVQEGGNMDKNIASCFVHCGPNGSRQMRSHERTNTVRMILDTWADGKPVTL
jgi:hypothetical protein